MSKTYTVEAARLIQAASDSLRQDADLCWTRGMKVSATNLHATAADLHKMAEVIERNYGRRLAFSFTVIQ